MDLGLAGKTVIVTGGGSNIGRGILLAFAKEGSNVVNAEIDERQGQKVANEANALGGGGRTVLVRTDVTDNNSVVAMIKKTLDEFSRIDVLVNNVGWVYDRLFIEKPREEVAKEININLWGVINCTRAVIDHMIEQKYGKIINIASDAGRMGEYNESVYSGCKGGVIALSKALARELGRYGINVNVVCPGVCVPEKPEHAGEKSFWTEWGLKYLTPEAQQKAAQRYPLRRLAKPQDIAPVVLFLASDAASYMTGQTLSVSGGYSMM